MSLSTAMSTEAGSSRIVSTIFEKLERSSRPAFHTTARTITWDDWIGTVESLVKQFERMRGARVGLLFRSSEVSYALLVSLSLLDADLFLFDDRTSQAEIEERAAVHRLDSIIDPCGEGEQIETRDLTRGSLRSTSGRGEVTIFTSGSTGRPKAIRHDWHSLTRPVRKLGRPTPQCWLLTYRPHLYGGLQVFMHCFVNQDPLALAEPGMPVDALLEHIAAAMFVRFPRLPRTGDD